MTTPRIEEMVEKVCEFDFENKLWSDDGYNEFKDLLRTALTEAYEWGRKAGIDEAVEIVRKQRVVDRLDGNGMETISKINTIKALQDKK